ncbi:MAG: GtrA family protein [Bacillota bacterium]|nr:GtrA family protein [Bacillota bacterium]
MISNTLFDGLFKSKRFLELFNKKNILQLGKTFIIGVAAAGCDFSIYHFLYKYMNLSAILSSGASQIVGFWVSFLLNKFWTFKIKEDFLKQLSSYTILFIFNLLFSTLALYLFVDIMHKDKDLTKIFTMGIIFIWNFVVYKKLIYKVKGVRNE